MTAAAALAATATLLSTAFCLSTLERWRRNRRPHELAWTVALTMFVIAALAYFWAAAVGWNPANFRVFYLFGAILNVAWLALGTVYLLGGTTLGDRTRWWLTLLSAFCAGVVLSAPIEAALPTEGIPSGREVLGVAPRVMAAVGSGVGATIIIAGALWSAVSLLRTRRRPGATTGTGIPPGRLVLTNVLIAVGSLVLGAGGTLFGTGEEMVDFGIWLSVGVGLLFAGFLVSNPSRPVPVRERLDPYWVEIHDMCAGE
jgi:hypothetical protein